MYHDHHYRRCGNPGCATILAEELFVAEEIAVAEDFACGGCGGGYIAPRMRSGYDDFLATQGAVDIAVGEMTGDPLLVAEGVADEIAADFGW